MTAKKIKKYIFVGVVSLLALLLLSAVFTVISVSRGWEDDGTDMEAVKEESFDSAEITAIEINLDVTSLIIRTGDFKLTTNNEDIEWETDGQTLRINEKGIITPFGIKEAGYELVLTIPEYTTFDSVNIASKVGKIDVSSLNSVDFKLRAGVGNTQLNDLYVSGVADIKTFIGKAAFKDVKVESINYKIRIGQSDLDLSVKSEGKFKTFAGRFQLYLPGEIEDYGLTMTEGFGLIKNKQDIYTGDDASKPIIDVSTAIGKMTVTFER